MICENPTCGWPRLIQELAEEVEGPALAMCIIILTTADKMDPGTFFRACRVATLREASLAELTEELLRRGGPEA